MHAITSVSAVNRRKGRETKDAYLWDKKLQTQNIPKHDGMATIVADIDPDLHLPRFAILYSASAIKGHRRTHS
jgi:hypothetical protein